MMWRDEKWVREMRIRFFQIFRTSNDLKMSSEIYCDKLWCWSLFNEISDLSRATISKECVRKKCSRRNWITRSDADHLVSMRIEMKLVDFYRSRESSLHLNLQLQGVYTKQWSMSIEDAKVQSPHPQTKANRVDAFTRHNITTLRSRNEISRLSLFERELMCPLMNAS